MHEYIAALLTLLLIIGFIPQNTVQLKNHVQTMKAEAIIEVAKEEAAQEGRFTNEIINKMKDSMADAGIDTAKLQIDVTTTVKYRTNDFDERELISYEIGVPIKKIIANNEFFGISDDDNEAVYWYRGKIASEKVGH